MVATMRDRSCLSIRTRKVRRHRRGGPLMKRVIALLVLSFLVPSVARAVDAGDCRNLLTLDEVAGAVGGAAELTSASKRGEVGTGSVENPRLQVCSWAAASLLG